MLDKSARKITDRVLIRVSSILVPLGITPIFITVAGFFVGLSACVMIWQGYFYVGLGLMLLNRIMDGLDGTLARYIRKESDLGAYLDITLDFLFYSGYVFAFAVNNPEIAIYAAFLMFSFFGTGVTFLMDALFMEKRKKTTVAPTNRIQKGISYIGGLAEGTETIAVFILITLFPEWLPKIALIFGGICWVTTFSRIRETVKSLH